MSGGAASGGGERGVGGGAASGGGERGVGGGGERGGERGVGGGAASGGGERGVGGGGERGRFAGRGGAPAAFARGAGAVALLAGPAVVGFASGGYFAIERLWAALAAIVLAALAAALSPRPLPRSAPGRIALAALAGLLGWTLLSRAWAPLAGPAIADAERLTLYLATLVAAAAFVRGRWARAAEPALAAGAVAVLAYGLSERVLPGVIDLADSRSALGRLEQPLTYWNAMGALAAMALALLARLAGDHGRAPALRAAAAAAATPAGAALLLAFSRGAIAAALIGIAVLVALAPTRAQLRAALTVALTAAAAGALAAALPAVRTMEGAQTAEGLVLLGGLALLGAFAAVIAARPTGARRAAAGTREAAAAVDDAPAGSGDAAGGIRDAVAPAAGSKGAAEAVRETVDEAPGVRQPAGRGLRPGWIAAGAVIALALVVGAAAVETSSPRDGATAARLGSADSNRYAYWGVALDGFADAPLRGHGAGSFGVLWLRDRTLPEVVRDAHSIWLETAAELGLVGLALLAALFGGVAVAAARARHRAPGAVAALAVWAAHSALDWDWELPGGPTLTALVLAGAVIALADEDGAVEPLPNRRASTNTA